ncbi:MAG: 3-hydroxy-5-phosphonooxypentane-2,4-dione thiolase [Deltaproteobacteria bacterium]|nr:3-hydroxy-5-phosphonooxypentane-2,4-dione thiolase [Deltaproteobacteria bacterium]
MFRVIRNRTFQGETLMDWGMRNRLSRIIKPATGKTVMLAVDHGYFQGPTTGLKNPGKTIKPLLPYADALMLTRGILRSQVDPGTDIPIILRVSGGTSVLKDDLSDEEITVSIEEAVRLNASAVALSVFVGAENERQTLVSLSRLVNEAQTYGIPVLAVTAVGKQMVRDARYLGLASRISAELGAHVVKTYYCDGFKQVSSSVPVPTVIAGGKKLPERDALVMTKNAIASGAVGVDMGRNIFQSDSPVGMIKAVRAIVHQGAGVDAAYRIYEAEKKTKAAKKKVGKGR